MRVKTHAGSGQKQKLQSYGGRTMNNALGPGDGASRDIGSRDEAAQQAGARRMPQTVAQTGLDMQFIAELTSKAAAVEGKISLAQLVDRLKLAMPVLEEATAFMVRERQLEITHRGASDFDVHFQLTEEGRVRAIGYLTKCAYVGPAPVTLDDYAQAIASQSVNQIRISRPFARAAFAELTISEAMVDELGGAMNSGRPILFYGPAGGGKTHLAECLARLLPGAIDVPYAVVPAGSLSKARTAASLSPSTSTMSSDGAPRAKEIVGPLGVAIAA